MSIVNGSDVVVEVFDSGIWKLYGCARTCSLTTTTDTLETSGPGTGIWRSFIAVINSYAATIDGITNLDTPNVLSLADLRAKQLSFAVLQLRITRTDQDGNVYIDQGNFLITSAVDNGNYADVATFNISLQGTGAITTTFVPSPTTGGNEMTYNYTATGGETSFSSSVLFGVNVLEAFKDGIRYKVITSGSPSDKIAVYSQSGGQGIITFDQAFEPGELGAANYQSI